MNMKDHERSNQRTRTALASTWDISISSSDRCLGTCLPRAQCAVGGI